jgi:Tfp pilus assembly protein PilV
MNVQSQSASAASTAGFTLLEAVISVGIITLALAGSYMLALNLESAQGRLVQRTALNTLIDNLATDVRAGTAYNDATNASFAAGNANHEFTYDAGGQLGQLHCAVAALGTAGAFVSLHCQTDTGVFAERIVRVPTGAPVPGSVVTAAPQVN